MITTAEQQQQSLLGRESPARNLWSLDEYIVVADLYLKRRRSSGIGDLEVLTLARLTGRSPASISRRLGNFDGTVRAGMGLKPVVGEALATFRAMREDDSFRSRVVGEATDRLRARGLEEEAQPAEPGPRLVDPEEVIAERVEVVPSAVTRQMIRAEALLVRHYCGWLDPSGVRLRGVIIPAPGHVLRADLYDTERELLIEAKAEASRESLRYAIGQLFDYRRYLDRCRSVRALALLVPSAPDPDLALLPGAAGVAIIWRTDDGFTDSVDGQYTRRTQTPLTGLARDT